jgi:hypothetical protein
LGFEVGEHDAVEGEGSEVDEGDGEGAWFRWNGRSRKGSTGVKKGRETEGATTNLLRNTGCSPNSFQSLPICLNPSTPVAHLSPIDFLLLFVSSTTALFASSLAK